MISGLKWVNAGAAVGLCFLVYGAQKAIWKLDKLDMLDMKVRQSKRVAPSEPLLEKPQPVAAKGCTY